MDFGVGLGLGVLVVVVDGGAGGGRGGSGSGAEGGIGILMTRRLVVVSWMPNLRNASSIYISSQQLFRQSAMIMCDPNGFSN